MDNVVIAAMNSLRTVKTRSVFRNDYGMKLKIKGVDLPSSYEVHFSNSKTADAVTMIGDESGVSIPDALLTSGNTVFAWLFLHNGESGYTVYEIEIPVRQKPDVTDTPPTPVQQDTITRAIEALQESIEEIENMTVSAETLSAGSAATVEKTIVDGVVNLNFGIPRGESGGGGQQTDDAVLYTEQFLTDAQKAQARTNIGAPGFSDIPQKTSELQNDSGFITAEDIPAVPEKTSELQNDSGFITAEDIPAIPTKTSELQNDSGFITAADIPAAPVQSVNGKTGAVVLTASDVGAEVTPASVVTATGQMSDAQKTQTRTNLGAVATSTMGEVYTRLEDLEALVTATETISGTTPTITPEANTIYQCGELTSLTITNPPATGAWSVVFTSGATATTTTIPASILGLEDFAPEANTLYEINVLDNRAVWIGWPLPEVTA